MIAILLAFVAAYFTKNSFPELFSGVDSYALSNYIHFYLLYIVTLSLFLYEGIYTHRYDFWHESKIVLKSIFYAFIIILAYLALTRTIQDYSRAVIILTFIFMALFIPAFKLPLKKFLYKVGLWQRPVKVYGNDTFLKQEIFANHYLGYVEATNDTAQTVFINSHDADLPELKETIGREIEHNHEVIFIPLMDDYDLTQSHIYKLSNTRTNLIVFQNRLKSHIRLWGKKASDIALFIIVFPLITPVMLYIAYKIRKEEPDSSILFRQERLGQHGKTFVCYKFRTMYEDGDSLLQTYLAEHPEEVTYYETYHKYQNDPRITRIGHFLRKTSLDELPQIFNVFKNEMSFIGPRPYMLNEKEKIGKAVDTILSVKPGITGLWQVSGRSEVDFYSRVELDIWYIRNWNLWMDFEILLKTIKTVLVREGAA
jgi:undecaprenyl-phosphate galactose phosphotransferase